MFGLASAWMHLQIPMRSVGIWSLQFVWARRAPHKLFPNIFHGKRSEFREKYGLGATLYRKECRLYLQKQGVVTAID
jgi:hypothetical protein